MEAGRIMAMRMAIAIETTIKIKETVLFIKYIPLFYPTDWFVSFSLYGEKGFVKSGKSGTGLDCAEEIFERRSMFPSGLLIEWQALLRLYLTMTDGLFSIF